MVADTLLARSIEGSVEQYFKDGELVGEKRVIDNRLGLAILRRLDRLAETGSPLHSNFLRPPCRPIAAGDRLGSRFVGAAQRQSRLARRRADDAQGWRSSRSSRPPESASHNELRDAGDADSADGDDEVEDEGPTRVWCDEGIWYTNFAPPPGYSDFEKGEWGKYGYKRICSDEESRMLETEARLASQDERTVDEAARDAWFAELKADLEVLERAAAADPLEQVSPLEEARGGDYSRGDDRFCRSARR